MDGREALLILNGVKGLGTIRLHTLLSHFSSPQDLFGASAAVLREFGLSEQLAQSILDAPRKSDFQNELASAEKEGVMMVTLLDEMYPKSLREIHDAPVLLYVKGELPSEGTLCLSIVGSRRASPYGLETAERISRELAGYGFTIVSGFARGIDTASHRGALLAKGRTVAVFGSGLLEIYPSENKTLAKEVSLSGALVSEFPMTYPALPENFPRRNRVISGLSLGVLVVEADERSGALITADFAMEQGREVFAIPGRIDSSLSRGTHRLIQQGAKLVQEVTDILEELKIPIAEGVAKHPSARGVAPTLAGGEEVIYEHLTDSPKSIDTIVEETRLSAQETLSTLVQLEVKKLVKEHPGKRYTRV
ncbi:MAG: DNA-protecting protein DprA [Candidatus Omnitrophica bacterium]|nr:DNA-protecting protein DprA [Candidatus Omnitrophota bacterium]